MNSQEFLLGVWALQCQPGDFVCLSTNSPWKDYSFPYDEHLGDNLDKWLSAHAKKDMYFCPLPFTGPRRSKALVARSRILWSDIDYGDYSKCEPSILWESSPGRFQGIWILPKVVNPDEAAQSSKQMAYFMGGDRGGWDLTQVLRIPGTPNLKYDDHPIVKLTHFTDKILRKVPQSLLDRWRSVIPRKVMRIIEGPAEQGKRSDMLWFLEHELCDLGIPLKDVFSIIRDTEWNKYRGREDENERFESEMEKIRVDRGEKKAETRIESLELQVVNYYDLMASGAHEPGWMVKDFWLKRSHGIIAGEPKSFKSTLCMDMLFSVASGTPFLGLHEVHEQGPVLVIQNENADWIMKDRLGRLAESRGTCGRADYGEAKLGGKIYIDWPKRVPLYFVNQQSFMLDDAANKQSLEELIDRLRPVAINLDPLYLMFAGDVNSAKDLGPVLQWCLYIKQTYNCAVILVHHYGKGNGERRGGQRMLGSTTLHGWIESAWYLQTQETPGVITVEREFRGAGMFPKIDITIDQGTPLKPIYKTTQSEHTGEAGEEDWEAAILDLMAASPDLVGLGHVQRALKISNHKAQGILDRMMASQKIIRKGSVYDKA
jgi:hypothetical protein